MKYRLFTVAALLLGLSGCADLKKVVYRIDVPQGNYLEQHYINQLEIGMNKTQVQYLLGTPMLRNSFEPNRWDYVFIKREGHNEPEQRALIVHFDHQGLVSEIQQIEISAPKESDENLPDIEVIQEAAEEIQHVVQ